MNGFLLHILQYLHRSATYSSLQTQSAFPCWGFISQAQLSETNLSKVLGMGGWVPLLYLLPPVWAGSVYLLCSSNSPSGVLVQGKNLGYRQLEENSTHTKKGVLQSNFICNKRCCKSALGVLFPNCFKTKAGKSSALNQLFKLTTSGRCSRKEHMDKFLVKPEYVGYLALRIFFDFVKVSCKIASEYI